MKKLALLVFLLAFCPSGNSAEMKPSDVALTGIINLPGYKSATFVFTNDVFRFPRKEPWALREGDRHEQFEVLEIKPVAGRVKMKWNQTNFDLLLDPASNAIPGRAIQLQNMDMSSFLKLYAQFSGRTVLRAALPDVSFTLNASAVNQAEAASVLTNALKQRGIITILDGDKFVQVMPESWVETAKLRSAQIKSMHVTFPQAKLPNTGSIKPETLIRAGDIDMPGIALQQAIEVYPTLVGAMRVEEDEEFSQIPPAKISLTSQSPLSREEAIYAFDTLFSWNGIKVVPSTNNMVKIVRLR